MIDPKIFKEILDLAINVAFQVAFPAVAKIPFVKFFTTILLNKIFMPVFVQLAKFINFTMIDLRDDAESFEANKAKNILQGVLNDPNSTPDQIDKARADFRTKYGALIHQRLQQS